MTVIISIIYFSAAYLLSQETTVPDSIEILPKQEAGRDSLRIGTVSSASVFYTPSWNDIRGYSHPTTAKSPYQAYRYDDFLSCNMTGWADFFSPGHEYYLVDFMDPALPRYLAASNMLPHQTGIRLDGQALNDPISGLVNTRIVSPDIISWIETDDTQGHPASGLPVLHDGINLTSFRLKPEEPLTRIKYTEGDFGYTDLDISFARNLGSETVIYLGGYNRDYDKTSLTSTNYRAGLDKQFGRNLDYRLQAQKIQTGTFFDNLKEPDSYLYRTIRHDISNEFFYWTDREKQLRWHLQAAYTHDRKTIDAVRDTSLFSRYRYYQFQFNADRNIHVAGFEAMVSSSVTHDIIWGTSFPDHYRDTRFTGRLAVKIPSLLTLEIHPDIGYAYQNGCGVQLLPGVETIWKRDRLAVTGTLYRSARFPNRIERSVELYDVSGNSDLKPEYLTSIAGGIAFSPSSWWSIRSDLSWKNVEREIRFEGSGFRNAGDRAFLRWSGTTECSFWNMVLRIGGQITDAAVHLTPEQTTWGQAVYRDTWLNGAVGMTISGGFRWYGEQNRLRFHQGLQRFYRDDAMTDPYYVLFYKVAATVKDAHLYFEMDNALSRDFAIVSGYYELIRRVRFGVNWKLWN